MGARACSPTLARLTRSSSDAVATNGPRRELMELFRGGGGVLVTLTCDRSFTLNMYSGGRGNRITIKVPLMLLV